MQDVSVKVFNTYISISFSHERYIEDMRPITKYLTSHTKQWDFKTKRYHFIPDKKWYWLDKENKTYYFPISIFNFLYGHLKTLGIVLKQEDIQVVKDIKIEPMLGKFKSDVFKLRDYQEAYQKAITEDNSVFRLVDLKTGAGKTLISFYSITKLGYKTAIVLLPRYISKWIEDVEKYTDISMDRVFVVQGRESFQKLLTTPNDRYDIVIFSLTTLSSWIKDCESGELGDNKPYELFNRLSIGVLLSDECHQALGSLAKIIMFSNVKKVIGLSATYIGNDSEDKKFKSLVFPESTRISNIVKFASHIQAYSCPYRIDKGVRIKDRQQNSYSHVVFEQSIMSRSILLQDYIDMVDYYLTEGYLSRRKEGQRCLIFFATISMCTYAHKFFSGKYKDLKVRRYVGEDNYDTMQEGDIIISTLGSFGTALETSNLITVIQTVCIRSTIANIQSAGRLRKLEGVKTALYSLWCSSLQTHTALQKVRESALSQVVQFWKSKPYTKTIPTIFNKKKRNIFYS